MSASGAIHVGRKSWADWLREIWRSRALIYFLAWRDVKVRYRQTALGVTWALLQPILLMLVFSVFIGHVVHAGRNPPYALFAYAGLVVWQCFAFGLNAATQSLIENERLITRVYFPRAIIPLAAASVGLVDFALSFTLLLLALIVLGAAHIHLILMLAGIVIALATATGAGLFLAALNVRYRDVRYTLNFLNQFWFFATPVAYPAELVPQRWQFLYGLNPMAAAVDLFRAGLLGTAPPRPQLLIGSFLALALLLLAGISYFRASERSFVDVI